MPFLRHLIDVKNNVLGKQDELLKKSTTYNTERINLLMSMGDNNGKPDTTPFFSGKTEWKDAGIIFEYTDEEWEELEKCAIDVDYFVSHYCKFLNTKGRTLVKLRDYQTRILKVMGEEKWDDDSEAMVPLHPLIVLMQSRLSGKCLTMSNTISVKQDFANHVMQTLKERYNYFKYIDNIHIYLFLIYFSLIENPSKLDKQLLHLYDLSIMFPLFKRIFNSKIYKLESIKFKDAPDLKLIETIPCNFEVSTLGQFNTCIEFHRTKPFYVYHIILDDSTTLDCADRHYLYADVHQGHQDWFFCSNLSKGDFLLTKSGWKKISSIKKSSRMSYMSDLTLS